MRTVIPKKELLGLVQRLMADAGRGISVEMFARFAGVDRVTLYSVFVHQHTLMSEYVQRRVSKAYEDWRDGKVQILEYKDGRRELSYRKTPRVHVTRHLGLNVENGAIVLKPGLVNRCDYSRPSLADQLEN